MFYVSYRFISPGEHLDQNTHAQNVHLPDNTTNQSQGFNAFNALLKGLHILVNLKFLSDLLQSFDSISISFYLSE